MSFKILRKVAKHDGSTTTVQIKIKFVLSSIFPMSFFEPANHAMSTLVEPAKETYQSSYQKNDTFLVQFILFLYCFTYYLGTYSPDWD